MTARSNLPVHPFTRTDAIYRMVPHHEADDSCRLGWEPTQALNGTTHGQWSVLMMWICGCGRAMRVPVRSNS